MSSRISGWVRQVFHLFFVSPVPAATMCAAAIITFSRTCIQFVNGDQVCPYKKGEDKCTTAGFRLWIFAVSS
jgi:hypothetical protein